MTDGMEFLERVYAQLHEAGIIRSKGQFSERLLGKSPSYLTSMRAKQWTISGEVIVALGDNLMTEILELGSEPAHAENRALLRRAVAQVNCYLADQTIPAELRLAEPLRAQRPRGRMKYILSWFRALLAASPKTSPKR